MNTRFIFWRAIQAADSIST